MDSIDPKVVICTCICETLFPIIDTIRSAPDITLDNGHPRYSISLYSKLRSQQILGGNSVSNNEVFMRAILSIWHKMRYGEPDWIAFEDFVNSDDYKGSHYELMSKKIANFQIVQKIKEQANIVWYSGKAWEPYRNSIGTRIISNYEAAGVLLAQFWPWGDSFDHDNL